MDVYTQAVAPAKHAAQAAVLALFFPITMSEDEEALSGRRNVPKLGGAKGHQNVAFCTLEYLAKLAANV
jgi:hypothetical protein